MRRVSCRFPLPQEGAHPTRRGVLLCLLLIYNPGSALKHLSTCKNYKTLKRPYSLKKKSIHIFGLIKETKMISKMLHGFVIEGQRQHFNGLSLKLQETKLFLTGAPCTIGSAPQSIMIPISVPND